MSIVINTVLVSGLTFGSVYLFAKSLKQINLYNNYYVAMVNGIVFVLSGSVFGYTCYKCFFLHNWRKHQ